MIYYTLWHGNGQHKKAFTARLNMVYFLLSTYRKDRITMAFDGIVVADLVHEFRNELIGGRIAKIARP